ncbi:hypothetical protein R75461_08184 [Paraburkholderia nemoris]|uniref:hypothetical protein n=1 Tax=Paraburkholderia nemoris TaxID=2793076 RepID=UPI00190DBA7C|nr:MULTISPECIES: hypothetical protein [Paraburkholderia]MBK3786874.1 hypothetical protein [Paraburkholderia aspalathi]CAE6864502.1 hypothetical protein R75461_08184 [Paraburkholderia nemoris]
MRATEDHQTSSLIPASQAEALARDDRAWFLDSLWHDPVWVFKPTSALEEGRSMRIDWRFKLPSGELFVEPRFAQLLHSCKQVVAIIRSRSLGTGLAQRATTTFAFFMRLRTLVRWMDQAGYRRFADLDATALLQFQCSIVQRPGVQRDALAPSTVRSYLDALSYLYRFRDQLDDGLQIDPFPSRDLRTVMGARGASGRHWPYTPEAVAVPLVQGAIDLVTRGSAPILQARDIYTQAMSASNQRGYQLDTCTVAATRALRHACIEVPGQSGPILSVYDLRRSIDALYAACFVVISYLVGPRASEILQLKAGCVQRRRVGSAVDEEITVIVGSIFKGQPEYAGRPHEWVAPPPVVATIAVLEALSAGHRAQTGSPKLWLRSSKKAGATEWQLPCPGTLKIMSSMRMALLLQRFAARLVLPQHDGKAWLLTTHQGRKTFARFAALRDGSALLALAQHLGHRERAVTDSGYAGTDYHLNREIEAEVLEQSVSVWEHMLVTPSLGGRAGAEIMAKRPRFRGTRIKQDVKSYARLLVDAGLALGVCDWGYCVYREEHSACLGNAIGPNPARREPSTCARCKNFAVSDQHRPYWVEQVHRHERLLNEPTLPLQTLRIVRERMEEARSLVRAIDATKEADDAKRKC